MRDELEVHREWLGLLQPVGVVVSPTALQSLGFVPERSVVDLQRRLHEVRAPGPPKAYIPDLVRLFVDVLGWKEGDLRGPNCSEPVPDDLSVVLPNYGETLRPTWSVHDPMEPSRALLLVNEVARGTDLDAAGEGEGWHASPQAKFERLLTESKVRVGLLSNGEQIRLVHTPEHQTSGHLTFPVQAMCEVAGRPILAAFDMLLRESRVLSAPEGKSLFDVLKKSRDYQNDVSNKLAEQVLHALWELLRGFEAADAQRGGTLLKAVTPEDRDHVYGGLLTSIMRMVFLLYAEDQGLLPKDAVWVRNYAVAGLHKRLRDDAALNPDTMDQRYGAWAALLALFRIVHNGGGHGAIRLPGRKGQLFDPDAYPFLEGRPAGSRYDPASKIDAPKVSDGCLYRVLEGLLVLDGERLSYRALDVEQIGSVYEAMMGYVVERMPGRSLAVRLRRKGIPGFIFVDLDELLAQPAAKRAKWIEDAASCKLTGSAKAALEGATTPDEVFAALERRVSEATPRVLPAGALVLQPGEERRRSGSHYTPRELTQPIVRTTLRPILEALGARPTPKQILDLKVCDPAMGSGAFLVEACRQLAEALVTAWETHAETPEIPPDEDALLHAKRLIAQRCLYGVDKNPFAVNLAKLSLWLVTLARDHPFTFVDHALRHGDSLVGLTRDQIRRFHWDVGSSEPLPLLEGVAAATDAAREHREALEVMSDEDEEAKRAKLAEADATLTEARLAGDLVVAAFFSAEKPKDRAHRLAEMRPLLDQLRDGDPAPAKEVADAIRRGKRGLPPYHWEIEFPEVFTRSQPGFDAIVGNPPFAGRSTTADSAGPGYIPWLQRLHPGSHGNSDLVAHFFRRAIDLIRRGGTFGLIATKTIAQGDTRATGLRWICEHGGEIYCARKRLKWPGSAAVVVSVIHVVKGSVRGPKRLDNAEVDTITAFLFHRGDHDDPVRLKANSGLAFQGCVVVGMGFTFDDSDVDGVTTPLAEMARLIEAHPSHGEVVFPYIGGDEVNVSPTHAHHRYIINFEERSEDECRHKWPALMAIVERKVRPEREAALAESWSQDKQDRVNTWWQFARTAKDLYAAIQGLDRVLVVNCGATPHMAFVFLPTKMTFANTLAVAALATYSSFAALQARPHEIWARFFGSTLEDRLRYALSDCFETFPFPPGWREHAVLEAAGKEYYEFRAQLMVENNEGLTKTYNRFHDPDERDPRIVRLRELHDAMDRAVLDAYGWTDIRPNCEFILDYEIDEEEWGKKKKPYRYRWPDEIRDEVLGRLLELNRQRAEQQRLAGKGAKRGRKDAATVRRLEQPKRVAEGPLPLFGNLAEAGGEE